MNESEMKSEYADLRRKAEELLKERLTKSINRLSESEMMKLIHELEVHQIELEMQTEELMHSRLDAQDAIELYDYVPSAYFRLSKEGEIMELNLSGANMLGKERAQLKNSKFGFLVTEDSRPIFNSFLKNVFSSKTKISCELKLTVNADLPLYAQLNGILTKNGEQCLLVLIDITEHLTEELASKEAKEKLKQSEARFRNILKDVQSVSVQGYGPDGMTQYWNKASELLYGYTEEEAIGRNLTDLIVPPEMREDVLQAIHQMVETGQAIPASELTLMRKDRSLVSVFSSHVIIQLPGQAQELFCIDIDISDRKKTEEALKESNELLSLFMKHSPIFAFIKEVSSVESRVLIASENYKEMIGITGSEMVGKTMYDLFPPEFAAKFTADDWSVVSTGQLLKLDEDMNGRNYTTFKFPIVKGERNLLAGYTIDITDRKQVEEKLRKSKKQYDNLASKIPVGVYILHSKPNGAFSLDYVSPKMAEMLNQSVKSLLSNVNLVLQSIHPDDMPGFVHLNQEGIREKQAFDWKGRFLIDGEIKWLHFESSPEIIENGDILWHGLVTDISGRIRSDAEIKLQNLELQKINAEKDKFFSIIAHDLRNPFNSFLGLTQIMEEELPRLTLDEIQKFAVSMRKSATHLFRLLENLLEWAKLQQGIIPFHRETVQLRPLVDESISMKLESAKIKGVEIFYDIPDDLEVFADTNMLQTIIRNLVSNALKFTPQCGNIYISAHLAEEKGVEITIKDRGIGMSQFIIDHLFNLDVNTSRKGTEGETSTGLGLIICKDFIEKHGGELCVESEEGKGSTFYFCLPK